MKPYIIAAENHLNAAQTKNWDYPDGSKFSNPTEVLQAIKDGKTIYAVYIECIVRYGTITGGIMNSFLGHTSISTRNAVRKGMKVLFTKL